MGGVRLAAVQVIATATIAALVAGGGLGAIITNGFGTQDQAEVVAGAFCVCVLALSVEGVMAAAPAATRSAAGRARSVTT